MDKETSKIIWITKAIAIFCVVCAHCAVVNEDAGNVSQLVSSILNYLGTMGVPLFFILSGYLFSFHKQNFGTFWRKKAKTLFLPWIFCETLLWLYIVLRKGGLGLKSWCLFLIGYEHTTYYLTVLTIFYLVFWIVRKKSMYYGIIVLSLVSIISTGWGIGINFLNEVFGTFYLNPLNWALFFVIGILAADSKYTKKIIHWSTKNIWLLTLITITYFILHYKMEEPIYYFSKYAIAGLATNSLLMLGISNVIRDKLTDKLILIGKYSFSIYLLHQFFAGLLVAFTNSYLNNPVVIAIRPIIIIALVVIGIRIIESINKKVKGKLSPIISLIGVR